YIVIKAQSLSLIPWLVGSVLRRRCVTCGLSHLSRASVGVFVLVVALSEALDCVLSDNVSRGQPVWW
ncbi:hypothetical protein, partial [Mycobacterium avium]|uniref:hypothetical protein n=1 Tax=Mycobacterium avium TaxID=1764 RepID=UPI001F376359